MRLQHSKLTTNKIYKNNLLSIFGFLINLFVLDQLFAVGWIGLVVRVLFATCTSSIMHLICPPKFCITFVFHFSWVLQPFQEKLKTMLLQNFGGTTKGRITPFCKKAYWEKTFLIVLLINLFNYPS